MKYIKIIQNVIKIIYFYLLFVYLNVYKLVKNKKNLIKKCFILIRAFSK